MDLTQFLSLSFGALTVIAQMAIVVGFIALFLPQNTAASEFIRFVAKYAFPISFAVALLTTLGSLYYSEIAGYNPCSFCWFQRVFMYPQVILLGFAWWRKEQLMMSFYTLVLSGVGIAIALYQYLLQLGVAPSVPCSATGISGACSQRFVMELGYITIPLMSLTAFLIIAGAMLAYRQVHLSRS